MRLMAISFILALACTAGASASTSGGAPLSFSVSPIQVHAGTASSVFSITNVSGHSMNFMAYAGGLNTVNNKYVVIQLPQFPKMKVSGGMDLFYLPLHLGAHQTKRIQLKYTPGKQICFDTSISWMAGGPHVTHVKSVCI